MDVLGTDFEIVLFEIVVGGSNDMTPRNLEMDLAARNSDGRMERLPFAWHFEISGEKCRFSSWRDKMILERFKVVSYKVTDSNSFT